MLERKARLSGSDPFVWVAQGPVESGSATLTVALAAGDYSPALTPVRGVVAIDSVADDRATLAASAPVATDYRGLQGDLGRGWLVTEEHGAFPVRVVAVDGATISLAEPLPRAVSGAGVLQWSTHTAPMGAANVTAALARNLLWRVEWTELDGIDAPARERVDDGRLHVVRSVFGTGLSSEDLLRMHPILASKAAQRAQDFVAQIEVALVELTLAVRADLRARDLWEDDVDGGTFTSVHAYLAAALVVESRDAERAEQLRAQAWRLYRQAIDAVWVDGDGDGVVDDGEVGALDTARAVSRVRSNMAALGAARPQRMTRRAGE